MPRRPPETEQGKEADSYLGLQKESALPIL